MKQLTRPVVVWGFVALLLAACSAADQEPDPLQARCDASAALDDAVDGLHDASTSPDHLDELEENLTNVRIRLAELDDAVDGGLSAEIAFVAGELDEVVNMARRDVVERADLTRLTSTAVVDAWGAANELIATTDDGCP